MSEELAVRRYSQPLASQYLLVSRQIPRYDLGVSLCGDHANHGAMASLKYLSVTPVQNGTGAALPLPLLVVYC